MKIPSRMHSGPLPWIVTGAAIAAGPLTRGAQNLKRWWDVSHLPIHVLRGPDGMEVHISPLGGVIQRLLVPDAEGILEDVVLGFDDMAPYTVRHRADRSSHSWCPFNQTST